MRRVTVAMLMLGFGLAALGLESMHARFSEARHDAARAETARLVRDLGLTDLALFTEARYVRHISQADLFTPFQDAPVSFEHFPSGTLVAPPAHLGRHAGALSVRPIERNSP